MASDEEIAKGVESALRETDPEAVISLSNVVQQVEAKLGLELSDKVDFIRDQITFLLRAQPVPKYPLHTQPPPQCSNAPLNQPFQQPNFAFQQQQQTQVYFSQPATAKDQNAASNASETSKGRAPAGAKRRGGPGGLNKVCGVSPKLQAIVGEPALPRTEIVKQLWAYIRKHKLQDPGNKRKIICDDALRLVFETDSTDMFKMNKLLAKHILPLDPSKAKKLKDENESAKQSPDSGPLPVMLSDALVKFFGTGEREMLQSKALERVWDYIKVNQLEDPLSSMFIHCDEKLHELLGCDSISALGIQEMLMRHHLLKHEMPLFVKSNLKL
ncbi:uncharacterized protein LOC127249618 [Andrographis paniculata]|uniref:uncharacterized protein LOC127249618 n=1 Tax=Andrographis paniculata TaxID=175694 RepID=UPI0021E75EA1|nr:uncharacterized protein LOC127249618 [Andrographis paniculata]